MWRQKKKNTTNGRVRETYGHGRLPEMPSFKRSRNDRCRLGPEPIGGNDGLLRADNDDDDPLLAAAAAAALLGNAGGEDMMIAKAFTRRSICSGAIASRVPGGFGFTFGWFFVVVLYCRGSLFQHIV